jgi:hypothetical protein
MRDCTRCGKTKKESEFYKRKDRKSGFKSECKTCTIKSGLKTAKIYRNSEKGRRNAILALRRFAEKNREHIREYKRIWRKKNPEKCKLKIDPFKNRCRYTLLNAIHAGKVIRPKICSECGWEGMIHAHHHDYSKPFDVEWLCSLCHGKRHRDQAIK